MPRHATLRHATPCLQQPCLAASRLITPPHPAAHRITAMQGRHMRRFNHTSEWLLPSSNHPTINHSTIQPYNHTTIQPYNPIIQPSCRLTPSLTCAPTAMTGMIAHAARDARRAVLLRVGLRRWTLNTGTKGRASTVKLYNPSRYRITET